MGRIVTALWADGKREPRELPELSENQRIAAAQKAAQDEAARDADPVHRYWKHYPDGVGLAMRAFETAQRNAWYRTKQEFPLTAEDVIKLLIRSQGRCEVSGLPFSSEAIPGCKNRPYVPSIDRIRPKELYSFDNCRLVCWAVNLALCDWGDAVFWKIVRSAAVR